MSDQDAFERVLAALHEAMLDDTQWPATSALIDGACGMLGSALAVGEGPTDDVRIITAGLYYRGERRADLEREYLEVYYPIDENLSRFWQLPDSRMVHVKPVEVRQLDFGARRVAALVLITEPGQVARIDPAVVAATLGLTPVESQIAALLAEGWTVREIAGALEYTERSVRWYLHQIYHKQGLAGQVDLVRLVLSVAMLA